MDRDKSTREIDSLREEIRKHDHLYYGMASPVISDFEYDQLLKRLEELESEFCDLVTPDSPTQRVGIEPNQGFSLVRHSTPMLSLTNCYTVDELRDFDKRLRGLYDREPEYMCELKIDGVALMLTYRNHRMEMAATRGDGDSGDDVTANVRTIKAIPLTVPNELPPDFEVRGEIYYPRDRFEAMNEQRIEQGIKAFMNPRNGAAGTLKLLDSREVAKRPLSFFAYSMVGDNLQVATIGEVFDLLERGRFPTEKNRKACRTLEEVEAYWLQWDQHRDDLGYDTDGVVCKLNDLDGQRSLGNTAKSPRWAIAFKYSPVNTETRLVDVTWQVGRTGSITPVADLDPVLLLGTWVKRATLHNWGEIERLGVKVGDKVEVKKGGEIIPKIVRVIKDERASGTKEIALPTNCPVCEFELSKEEDEAILRCPNWQCPAQVRGRIIHFASRGAMDIEGLGTKTVDLLVENDLISNVGDLYFLTPEKVEALPRQAELSAVNLIKGLEDSREKPFDRLLFGLGIRHVGSGAARLISTRYPNLDLLAKATVEDLEAIDEIGPTTAESIVKAFGDAGFSMSVEKLTEAGVTGGDLNTPQLEQIFAGKIFVLTGALENFSRDTASAAIRLRGGRVTSSVSKKTSYVLAGRDPGSKFVKAGKLGVAVIDEKAFERLLGEEMVGQSTLF
ncbi:MAG: NAD-dependent DNA ligase LigA [Calditrichaeota bacterium]|nr:NAD-dependent DNA ligase LigA [Calditrichota bacterium]